jgi:hypothetical protein
MTADKNPYFSIQALVASKFPKQDPEWAQWWNLQI